MDCWVSVELILHIPVAAILASFSPILLRSLHKKFLQGWHKAFYWQESERERARKRGRKRKRCERGDFYPPLSLSVCSLLLCDLIIRLNFQGSAQVCHDIPDFNGICDVRYLIKSAALSGEPRHSSSLVSLFSFLTMKSISNYRASTQAK